MRGHAFARHTNGMDSLVHLRLRPCVGCNLAIRGVEKNVVAASHELSSERARRPFVPEIFGRSTEAFDNKGCGSGGGTRTGGAGGLAGTG
mmetsp:Transcript_36561/g.97441  ORF Transcript_36561/g.97441 Transcript_36561/m.97441 type:complete len:90 (+) Transcript_36561:118-387(+)